jgi:serine/threonine-protein kinase
VFCPVCRSEYADDWKVCPKDASALLRSQFIGKYRIDQLLGAGGMGAVYRAYNPDTQSTVAIKLMHGGAQANDAARQRFQREAASVAALRTRHVVSIYDFGSDMDGTLYLVMEYMQGHALRNEILPMPNTMPLPRVNFVVEHALRGLGAAHRAGIVHRDLKPENLFVADTDDGEIVKVLDFGIARVSRGDTPNLTHSGALMGTPAYMAPEQVAGNRGQVGRHSDVYAVGVILYELVTGLSPFNAETLSEVLSRILSRNFTPLGQIRPDLPIAVSQLVDRALSDDPAARFGSADALREAWAAAWSQLPPEIRNAPVPSSAAPPGGAPAESAPGIGRATDVPSAPTAMPAHLISSAGSSGRGDALAATAASVQSVPGTVPGSRAAAVGSSPDRAVPGSFDPAQSVTPGPVVVDVGATHVAGKSRAGLWLGLAAVVLAGGALIAVLATNGKTAERKPDPSPGIAYDAVPGTVAHKPLDAGVAPAVDARVGTGVGTAAIQDAATNAPEHPDMALFTGGTFKMGIDPAKAKKIPTAEAFHEATVAPFFLDRTEMTRAGIRLAGGKAPAGGDDIPATMVPWAAAKAACEALGKRLPTAAEWELAARSAPLDPRKSSLLHEHRGGPAAAGSHKGDCTPDGVCDLLGNVMEWTADAWPGRSGFMVVRGASFNVGADAGWYATVQARLPFEADAADKEIGFRCAADAPPAT